MTSLVTGFSMGAFPSCQHGGCSTVWEVRLRINRFCQECLSYSVCFSCVLRQKNSCPSDLCWDRSDIELSCGAARLDAFTSTFSHTDICRICLRRPFLVFPAGTGVRSVSPRKPIPLNVPYRRPPAAGSLGRYVQAACSFSSVCVCTIARLSVLCKGKSKKIQKTIKTVFKLMKTVSYEREDKYTQTAHR